jgi:predicted ester cyclase
MVMTVDAQYEDGDVVVSRWTARGTQTGDLPMLPATGRSATVTGMLVERYEGDRIAETWSNWDTLGMLQQLGAIPAAEPAAT